MNKKIIGLLAVVVLLAVCVGALVACNPYKYESIGGGDATAAPVSNGGYVVTQGSYAYFVNGYAGESNDGNPFGSATKNAIVRASINNGAIDNTTAKVVVPKNVYTSSKKSGIAIFGEWIYYAAYNYDKDKFGNESTTALDFMRTKIDASVTQRIATINARSAEFVFTPTRVVYYANSAINYVDFSGMDTSKDSDNGKGTYSGQIAKNVTSVVWKYDAQYSGDSVCGNLFYTQSLTDESESAYHYNRTYVANIATGESTLLVDGRSYLAEGEQIETTTQKVFKLALVDAFVEDNATITLYYTKSIYLNSTDTVIGMFCNKYDAQNGFIIVGEKQLNSVANTTIYPLGYEKGMIGYNSNNEYCWYTGEEEAVKVTDSSKTLWYVDDTYAYYTASSDAKALYKIDYTQNHAPVIEILSEAITLDWARLEFVGDNFYFFAKDDKNYLHTINFKTFDKDAEDAKSTMIGIYLDADKPTEDSEKED